MKLKLLPIKIPLAMAVLLAASTCSSPAQNVVVNGSLTFVAGAGNVFDYTLTLNNTGPESVESLWLGWVPGSFNIANPSGAGNTLTWTTFLDGNSVQYGGTAGTALASGHSGIFTFDSTTTPAEFAAQTAQAGESTAYGVNAANGQLSFSLSPPDTETFGLTVVPEPSISTLLILGLAASLKLLRRKPVFAFVKLR